MNSQTKTPLFDALRDRTNHHHSPFYAPGHKGGQDVSGPLVELLGAAVFSIKANLEQARCLCHNDYWRGLIDFQGISPSNTPLLTARSPSRKD